MVDVIPAILPEDYDDIREHMVLVRGIVQMVQIDVTDGKFVPDATWPYINDPSGIFHRIINEEEAMPYWQEMNFEVDLMVEKAEDSVIDWIKAGARRVIPHIESNSDIEKIIYEVREITREKDSPAYTEIGLALNTTTPVNDVLRFLPNNDEEDGIDFIQCMGIEQIGYQGQEFDERVLDQIGDIRSQHPHVTISIDGGVGFDTVTELVEAGADRLVSGSAIFQSEDIAQAIEHLQLSTSREDHDTSI